MISSRYEGVLNGSARTRDPRGRVWPVQPSGSQPAVPSELVVCGEAVAPAAHHRRYHPQTIHARPQARAGIVWDMDSRCGRRTARHHTRGTVRPVGRGTWDLCAPQYDVARVDTAPVAVEKKSLYDSQRDTPRVKRLRQAFVKQMADQPTQRLKFCDESGAHL